MENINNRELENITIDKNIKNRISEILDIVVELKKVRK